jgi:hypothetical protein
MTEMQDRLRAYFWEVEDGLTQVEPPHFSAAPAPPRPRATRSLVTMMAMCLVVLGGLATAAVVRRSPEGKPGAPGSSASTSTATSQSRTSTTQVSQATTETAPIPSTLVTEPSSTSLSPGVARERCENDAMAPPVLIGGGVPGSPVEVAGPNGTLYVTWTDVGSGESLTQVLGKSIVDDNVDVQETSPQHVAVGGYRADVVPVGDPGTIRIQMTDPDNCLRVYLLDAGPTLTQAIQYTASWLSALA